MGSVDRPWRIDAGLARSLADAIGWDPGGGVAALAALMPVFVPMGSTAKLAAIAAGEVPPGEDPGALARRMLEHVEARAGSPGGGAASPTWSCWAASTVMAALVDAAGLGPVHVASTRRIDAGAPVVDFHAAVQATGEGGTWICDPYFGAAVLLPLDAGATATVTGPLGTASAVRAVDGGWTLDLGWELWDIVVRFRLFGPALDPGDVRAMAAVSVTLSGVPLRPYARVHRMGGDAVAIADASENADGTGRVATWTRAAGRSVDVVASWADAVEAFADRTGVRVV
ncbi:MAG: hypothetical protein ACTHN0_11050 [Aquihabitans sp.]